MTGAIHSAGVDIAEAVSRAAATQIAFLLLFLIFFLVISIGVRLLFSFADLVSRLPVLNLLNRLGGAFLGLVFGALVVVLLIAGCRFFAPKDSFPAL